jgi:LacI family transcriptional regulator
MNDKKISMADVAKLSGVSVATVSRILNKNGRYSQETEQRVMDIIKQYDYKLNMSAKSLRTNRSQSIGVIVPDITNEFFDKIIRSIENYMIPHHYSVFVCDSNENEEMENMHIENLVSKNVDGIIYISGKTQVKAIEDEYHIPVVYIDRRPDNVSMLIQSDNVTGGYLATEELIQKGCKRIVMLRDYRKVSTVQQRYLGYCNAHEKYGLPIEKELVVNVNVDYASAKKTMGEIIKSGIPFDGVFTSNDLIALGAIHALNDHNIRIPEDVKLVGFDNVSISEFCSPPITTVSQDTDKMGELSAKYLLRMLCGKKLGPERNVMIPVSLMKRKTT